MDHTVKATWGIKEIAFADLGKITSAVWEQVSLTKQGTFALTDTPATLTPVFVEEEDEPLVNKVQKGGTRQIQISMPDVSSVIAEFLGGTVTSIGSGAEKVNRFSFGSNIVNKMVRITPVDGNAKYIYITNGQITHNLSGSLTKAGDDTLDVQLTVAINKGLGGTDYESEGLLFDEAAPEEVEG